MIIFLEWKKQKRFRIAGLAACLLWVLLFQQVTVYGEETLDMYSGSYALTDGNTGRLLAGKEAEHPMANASTTKILTCIVALENADIEDTVVISANAAAQPSVRLGMKEGEQYPLKDLLYALMLESYNDCAVAIAEHVAGSEEAFALMMNQKAKEIGCQDTYFISPNGLDREDANGFHHTTAWDLCRIMAYCTWESPKKELFLEITQTGSYSGTANGKSYSFTNHNAFLNQMEGVLSGKTGFTNKAGYCYVAALEQNGERYCIALLACGWPNNKNYKWHDARVLLEYGLENYEIRKVKVEALQELIEVEGYVGEAEFAALHQIGKVAAVAEERTYSILLKEGELPRAEVVLYQDIELPIVKGQQLGECCVYLDAECMDVFMLTAAENVEIWDLYDIIKIIFSKFLTF